MNFDSISNENHLNSYQCDWCCSLFSTIYIRIICFTLHSHLFIEFQKFFRRKHSNSSVNCKQNDRNSKRQHKLSIPWYAQVCWTRLNIYIGVEKIAKQIIAIAMIVIFSTFSTVRCVVVVILQDEINDS